MSARDLGVREYWRIGEVARVLGRDDRFWRDVFDRGLVAGYRTERGDRYFRASSAREFLRGMEAAEAGRPRAVDEATAAQQAVREGQRAWLSQMRQARRAAG